MISHLKNKVERKLIDFITDIEKEYSIKSISPLLFSHIKEFVLRDGKRTRPILFLLGYMGFTEKLAPKIYSSALAIELIHDFMLVHDDIIDKSDTRRGKPSMHSRFNGYLSGYKNFKFNGEDLSIIAGDIMYAMSIEAFLSVKEDPVRKEKALRELIKAATYTGCGQFVEILMGIKELDSITKNDIYKIYELKTARYTFASPLTTGATLAGASRKEIELLFNYGLLLGKAFQIKDDILGTFGNQKEIGKSIISDLQEAKKTILIWYAYNNSSKKQKSSIKNIFKKEKITKKDLNTIKRLILDTGALKYARDEIAKLKERSEGFLNKSRIRQKHKDYLLNYGDKILEVKSI